MTHRLALGLALLLGVPATSTAMELVPPVPYIEISSTFQIDSAFDRDLQNNIRRYGTGSRSSTSSRRDATEANAHRFYSYDAAISRQVHNQMVDELQQQIRRSGQLNPEMQQWVRQLRAADLIGQVRQALRGDDYQPDSIATAMAFWITVNYGINQQLDLTRLSSHEMVRQFTEVLGQDSSIRSMSDAERQRTAAQLYWRGTLLMGLYLQAVNEGNREAVQQFVQSSEQALRSMGVGGNVVNRGNRLRLG